jgi:hypothetical protein
VERASRGAGSGSGRRPRVIDADRQADQRRVSHRSLDPACQHHDAGAGHDADTAAARRIILAGERAFAVTASACDDSPRAGGGQKAGCARRARCAEIFAHDRSTRSAFARGGTGSLNSIGRERLILSKADAGR